MMIAMMNWNTLGIEKVAANKIASYKAKRGLMTRELKRSKSRRNEFESFLGRERNAFSDITIRNFFDRCL